MPPVQGIVKRPLDETMAATRGAAAQAGYGLVERDSDPRRLVFAKGITLVSWGSKLIVDFERPSAGETELTITTRETFDVWDGDRGKRAALKLLAAVRATE